MPEERALIYKSYLGKTLCYRLAHISEFVGLGGRMFFNMFSTPTDSILDFLKKCDKLGYKI